MYLFVFVVIYLMVRLWWVSKLSQNHIDYVYVCVKRWHQWVFAKDENGNYIDIEWEPRQDLCKTGGLVNKQYNSVDNIEIMLLKFWVWNYKKFIKDIEVYKSISWDNPQDKNVVDKGWL